tara:strand:- start:1238 stop:1732 length:495 start_codon:yes stop_codon:yes gene_type:complete
MPKYNQYYKAKTGRVGVGQYRQYILARIRVSQYNNTRENYNSNSKQVLEMDIYNSYPDQDYRFDKKNHPLVNKRWAFWVNKTYLCIGYDIQTVEGKVFRPIYDHIREIQALEVRKDIVKYAKILVSEARHALYKKELMELHNKKIPDEIIEHIAGYTWDIMLLL